MSRPRINTKLTTDTLARVQAERARRNLKYFIEQAWQIVEPGRTYKDNWHIHAICEHLQAVSRRDIRRLIISMPPRSMKSTCVSIMWPAWTWIDRATERFMFASYSSSLSLDHSVKRRSIIRSDWYQGNWGDSFSISDDYDTKGEFKNDKWGTMIATSVDGAATGKGGDVVVVDDLMNPKEADSDLDRIHANRFFDQTLSNRFDDPKSGALVIVAQRLHEDDVIGHALETGHWEHLVLPMEFDVHRRSVTSLGWTDPRTVEGELLHEGRFGVEEVSGYKKQHGSYAYASQYQQLPSPAGGGMFKDHWWRYWKPEGVDLPPVMVRFPDGQVHSIAPVTVPKQFDEKIQSWDFAFKDTDSSDYVAGSTWGRMGADKYLLDLVNERLDLPGSIKAIEDMTLRHPDAAAKYVEDKANGPAVVQSVRHRISGVIATNPDGGKKARASAITPQVEAGNVYLPHPSVAAWVDKYKKQHSDFPNATHDDMVDTTSQALIKLGASEHGKLLPEFSRAAHIQTHELKSWWSRWVAMYWGNESCAVWFCQDDKKRVHVYRELTVTGASAEEFAAEVARKSSSDLSSLGTMTAWTSEDYFESGGGIKSVVQRFSDGFSQILGLESSFIWAYNDQERSMIPDAAYAALNARRKKLSGAKILLQHTKGEYVAAWEHLRHLARTSPVAKPAEVSYDRAFALQLLTLQDGPLKFKQYMDAVDGVSREILPKFYVADTCMTVADALSSAARSEKKPTELSETPHKHVLNAVAYGMLAHREEAIRLPKQEFIQQRLDSVKPQDGNGIFMVASKAAADYKKLHTNTGQPITFKRRSVAGYKH